MIKEGTLVKFKSREELIKVNPTMYNSSDINYYANRIALIVEASKTGSYYDYKVYFPDDDNLCAWSREKDFIVIKDLVAEYRK